MRKGENKKTFAYFEEIPYLKVDEYLYRIFIKSLDTYVELTCESDL